MKINNQEYMSYEELVRRFKIPGTVIGKAKNPALQRSEIVGRAYRMVGTMGEVLLLDEQPTWKEIDAQIRKVGVDMELPSQAK